MRNTNKRWPFKARLRTVLGLAVVSATLAPLALLMVAGCASENSTKVAKPAEQAARIAPKVLLPGRGGKAGQKDTLRQKSVLPWAEWIKR